MPRTTYNLDNFVFIDTETIGLDTSRDELLELTYAVGDNDPITLYRVGIFGYDGMFADASPQALKVNKILERFSSEDDTGRWYEVPVEFNQVPIPSRSARVSEAYLDIPTSTEEQWDTFTEAIKGKRWVGANPAFDVMVAQNFLGVALKHNHRLFDIQGWYAGLCRNPNFLSFSEIHKEFVGYVTDINADWKTAYTEHLNWSPWDTITDKPDHTARGDVIATREVFKWLMYRAGVYRLLPPAPND